MTPEIFRRIALRLPEAEEGDHKGHTDFRVRGRMFATMGWPDEAWGLVKLTPQDQALFVEAEPAAFQPLLGSWGRRGSTGVHLQAADEQSVADALAAAWRQSAAEAYADAVARADSPLDYAALEAAPLRQGNAPFVMLERFIKPAALLEAARDFPDIRDEASYSPADLDLKPGFKAVIDALDSADFQAAIEAKFGIRLDGCRKRWFIRRHISGDHRIHTDNPATQFVTVKLYFNPGPWTAEGGHMLMLGDNSWSKVLGELAPVDGCLTAFLPNDRSFHVNREYVGESMTLQLNWAPKSE